MRLPDFVAATWRAGTQESWGRLTALTPLGARLESLEAPAAERIFLTFTLSGETFSDIPCELGGLGQDDDGYFRSPLGFLRPQDRRRLRDLIARILLTSR